MNRGREVLVGAVILVGVAVAVLGTLWLSGSGFGRPTYPMDILVTDVGQLRTGNAVKFRGVGIGRVEQFTVEPGGEGVRIRILLAQTSDLPTDMVAIVAPESLFGAWQVELIGRTRFPGFDYFVVDGSMQTDPEAPVIGGFTLPDISRLTATANEISENLAVLSDRVDRAFTDETAAAFNSAIVNVESISSNLRDLVEQQAQTIDQVTRDVAMAASEIGAAARASRSTLEHVDSLLAGGEIGTILTNIATISEDLSELSSDFNASSGDLQSILRQADSTFARVDRLTARVESGQGLMGALLSDSSSLAGQTSGVLTQLEALLRDLRENPKRYVRLSIF